MSRFLVVLVTCPNRRLAGQLARRLVSTHLAACVNIVPAVESLFWWEGKVDRAREVLLLIKTTTKRFESLRRMIARHHPYDVPEILALPIHAAHRPYAAWLASTVR
ncbi:MAG: divalent-cation tolerance protein CutA [Candidatus Omnitrophica bacterium]|nr:divalent-cation tolerance protein CutA [Candidatus Omnitrophota bacterium]